MNSKVSILDWWLKKSSREEIFVKILDWKEKGIMTFQCMTKFTTNKKKKKKESTWEKNLLVRENSTCMGNAWSVWETARFLWPKETVEEEEVVEIADETESWRVLWEHWILIQNSVKI